MKAGIIGLGHGSRVLIHSFKLCKIEINAISARNYIKSKKIAKINKIDTVYKNWKELVKDQSINIIAIAVPPIEQIKIINECIKENKFILSEKPIVINDKEANELFIKLKKYKKKFLVDYIFPEHNAFKKFKKIIDSKKKYKQDIVNVYFNTQTYFNKNKIINWKSDSKVGGGTINQFLTHILDYLIIFFGKINEIRCNQEDKKQNFSCYLRFKSGIKANILINTNDPNKMHLIEYHSEKYKLILKNSGKDYCRNFKINKFVIKSKNILQNLPIQYKDKIINFKKDSRILLTSRIINNFKLKNKNHELFNYFNRIKYNEYIFEKCRISDMKKNIQKTK